MGLIDGWDRRTPVVRLMAIRVAYEMFKASHVYWQGDAAVMALDQGHRKD